MRTKQTPEQLATSRVYFINKNKEKYIGETYQFLTVLDIVGYDKKSKVIALVKCRLCGTEKEFLINELKKGAVNSCGCNRYSLVSIGNTKHGLSEHPLCHTWHAMKDRCYNEKCQQYRYYGRKGISVSDIWKNDFKAFYDWSINNGWMKGLQIDRFPNKYGGYSPDNCRWTTAKKNCNNKTNNLIFIMEGLAMTASEIADKYGIPYNRFASRLRMGYTVEDSIYFVKKKKRRPRRQLITFTPINK